MTLSRALRPASPWLVAATLLAAALAPACFSSTELPKSAAQIQAPLFQTPAEYAAAELAAVDLCPTGFNATVTFDATHQVFGVAVNVDAATAATFETLGNAGLDTVLFLYGPRDADGYYGEAPVAQDDDGLRRQIENESDVALLRARGIRLGGGAKQMIQVKRHEGFSGRFGRQAREFQKTRRHSFQSPRLLPEPGDPWLVYVCGRFRHEFQVRAHGCQRGMKFVRRVGHETTQRRNGSFYLRGHAVE